MGSVSAQWMYSPRTEDGASELEDPDLLDRAGVLGRVLFTRDDDLLVEATQRQKARISFRAKAGESEDLMNKVMFLPI